MSAVKKSIKVILSTVGHKQIFMSGWNIVLKIVITREHMKHHQPQTGLPRAEQAAKSWRLLQERKRRFVYKISGCVEE